MTLAKRTFLFDATARREYPMLRGFLAPQRDRPPKQPMPKQAA